MLSRASCTAASISGKIWIAVLEIDDAIAVDDGRAEQDPQFANELRVVGPVPMLEPALDLLLAARKIEHEQRGQAREQGSCNRGQDHRACGSTCSDAGLRNQCQFFSETSATLAS